VLREQPSHDELAIFRGVPILSIAPVELLGHPLRELTFVRVDGGLMSDNYSCRSTTTIPAGRSPS
jgi:hypothetical protein